MGVGLARPNRPQKIAQAHGGGIECRSTPQRTVFGLTLPRCAPAAA